MFVIVLTVVTFVLTEFSKLLTVVTLLLTAKTAPTLGMLVSPEASPTYLPKSVPAEIVEKNPKDVDVVREDVFDTVRRYVTEPLLGIFVNREASPANLP